MTLKVAIEKRLGAFQLSAAFQAPDGITALFGPSGSGKTSVVNAIAGLLKPDAGRIEVAGTVLFSSQEGIDTPVHRRRIGYVFQDGRLFPHMNVRRNLLYGAPENASPRDLDRVSALLDIAPLLDRAPRHLSGGEKQRVAIGRALLSAPDVLLMDEPLSGLDAQRKGRVLPYLERLRAESGVPVVYVTHAIEEVARLADSVVLMGGGRVLAEGATADILSDPRHAPLLGVREAGSVLVGRVCAHHPDGLSELALSGAHLFLPRVAAEVGDLVRVRIAAQDVILSTEEPRSVSALNILRATVSDIRVGDGPGAIVRLTCGEDVLLARITRRSAEALGIAPGNEVFAMVKSVSVSPADVFAPGISRG